MSTDFTQRLDEYDKDEWFAVARLLSPRLTREQYEVMWDEFQEFKADWQKKASTQ